jgi:hypothetical protein
VVQAIRSDGIVGTTSCATCPNRSSSASRAVASQSVSSVVSSRVRLIGLIETTMPPAFHVPITAMSTCGMFCRYVARRCPRSNPRSASATAKRSESRSSSARVSVPSKYRTMSVSGARRSASENIARALGNSGSMSWAWPSG